MIIVTNLGSGVNEYTAWLRSYRTGDREARRALPGECPWCGLRLHGHGSYWRKSGLEIRRVRCSRCRKTHAVLPSFLAPYRPCEMSLVERVFRLRLDGWSWRQLGDSITDISLCTMQRWVRRISRLATAVAAILSRDMREFDPSCDLDTLVRLPAGDELKLLELTIIAFWAACRRLDSGLSFPAGRLLELCNVHLNARLTGLWL